jgi:hypothetical protein
MNFCETASIAEEMTGSLNDAHLAAFIRSTLQQTYSLPTETALELLEQAWVAQKLLWQQRWKTE